MTAVNKYNLRRNANHGVSGATASGSGPHHDADKPIPSVEDEAFPDAPSSASPSTGRRPPPRVPSESGSPPPTPTPRSSTSSPKEAAPGDRNDASRERHRSESLGLEAAIQQIRLSSQDSTLNLADVQRAPDVTARGSDRRGGAPGPERLSVPPPRQRSRSRRRSSGLFNQPPYDVRDEEPPADAFNNPAFQRAFGDAKRVMSELTNVLRSSHGLSDDANSTMHQLMERAAGLADFQCSSTRKVGFVGDTGAGKSSLLNSLLHQEGLARAGYDGGACTCVATEFRYHDSPTFAIEVDLFSMDEITAHLKDMLRPYRRFHSHHQNEMDADEKKQFEETAKLAQDTFRSMFRGRLESESFLLGPLEDEILETLISWAADIRPSGIADRTSGLTKKECVASLMKYSSDRATRREPAVWPYIRRVRVFLNAHILSKGLVLVDLPGLRDLNSARVAITERLARKCDEVFAVCPIGRATVDPGVESVFSLAKQADLPNVGIVCTNTDQINLTEAIDNWEGHLEPRIRQAQEEIDQDEPERLKIEGEIEEFGPENELEDVERSELNEYRERLATVNDRITKNKFTLKSFFITARNDEVAGALREQHGTCAPSNALPVFCVSNQLYWSEKNHPRKAPRSINLSGVVEARRHCISIVSGSQHAAARRFIDHSVPGLLAGLELWVRPGAETPTTERRSAVRRSLDAIEEQLRIDLGSQSSRPSRIGYSAKEAFRQRILNRCRISEWSEAASKAGYQWSGWSEPTYAAFCRNYGNHTTGAARGHNWNEEAIECMVRGLKAPWRDLCDQLRGGQDKLVRAVESLTYRAIKRVEEADAEDAAGATEPLKRALIERQRLFVAELEVAYSNLESGLRNLRTDALTGIRSSFIGTALEDSYRACIDDSGPGCGARRKATMKSALGRESLFNDLMRDFQVRFWQLAEALEDHVWGARDEYLKVVRETLDIVRGENAALEGGQEPVFRERVRSEVERARGEMRRVQQVLVS